MLLAPAATAQMQQGFAALGPQGPALFDQLMLAVRQRLATAITDLFLVGCGAMVLAGGVTLFLREIPLRTAPPEERLVELATEAAEPFAEGPGEWAAADPTRQSPSRTRRSGD